MPQPKSKPEPVAQLGWLVDELRQSIIFGRLRPRERLTEETLTQRYGATRHQVRSAFGELERMGLLERRPNKGVVVRDFSLKEIEDLYDIRAILQGAAAERIPLPAPRSLLKSLRSLNSKYLVCVTSGEKSAASSFNNQFHDTLFAASGNKVLIEAIAYYWTQSTPIHWYALGDQEHLFRSHQDHERMIDALESGDRELLVSRCVNHIFPALEAYKRANQHLDAFSGR